MNLIAELKRRNVIRMAGLYLVGAWLIVQVVATVLPVFDVPQWVLRAIVVLLVLGLAPALVFSWVFELTPQGLKREEDGAPAPSMAPASERRVERRAASIAPQTARRMDRLIVICLAGIVVLLVAERLTVSRANKATEQATPIRVVPGARSPKTGLPPEGRTLAKLPTAPPAKSIAVLAFADLSADRGNEYFSDGIAEEILNALAQVKDLKVAGRTSSFYFKDKNEPLGAIGSMLGVAHILEGSVRRQGNRVRITAQLIQVKDGFHLWSDTYDGDIRDVFDLQEKIARAITDELKVVLGSGQQERLVPVSTLSPEAYALFLQATSVFNRRDGPRFRQAIAQLEKAIGLDPAFARAHARLASLYSIAPEYGQFDFLRAEAATRKHAEQAIALDPTLAEPHAALAKALGARRLYAAERKSFERALALDATDVTANFWFGTTLFTTGYLELGNDSIDRALERDPMLPAALLWRGMGYSETGDQDNAERLLTRAAEVGLVFVDMGLSEVADARGDKVQAARLLASGLDPLFAAFSPGTAALFAQGAYGDAKSAAETLRRMDAYLATRPEVIDGVVPYVLVRLGKTSRALALVQEHALASPMFFPLLWGPYGRAVRTSSEFADFARKIGLAKLWDAEGPPDLCRKDPQGNYVCT
ncbi:MAG: hypothetical protein ABIP49_09045 [Lysobacterales bacterium]